MDSNDFDTLINEINKVESELRNKGNLNIGTTKVVILGNTGCGKTSLTNSLTKNAIIARNRNKIEIQGEGISSGGRSTTNLPTMIIDLSTNLAFCDCPGFEDTNGTKQDIVNAFAIDFILNSEKNDQSIVVLIVASASEIDTNRGKPIIDSFGRVISIFPNILDHLNSFGLIITKGDQELKGSDFIDLIIEKSPENISRCLNYLKSTSNVFAFPMADKSKIGEKYEFNDKSRLIDFCQNHSSTDLSHRISLKENCLLELKICREQHCHYIKKVINDIFSEYNKQYNSEKASIDEIQKWLDTMHELHNIRIESVEDLLKIYNAFFPSNEKADTYLNDITKLYAFDDFLKKIKLVNSTFSDVTIEFYSLIDQALKILECDQKKIMMTEKNDKAINDLTKEINDLKKSIESNGQDMIMNRIEEQFTRLSETFRNNYLENAVNRNRPENENETESRESEEEFNDQHHPVKFDNPGKCKCIII